MVVQEANDQNLYLNKCLQARSDENSQSEMLLLQLMKITKSLYLTLRVQDAVPSYMEAEFNVSKDVFLNITVFIFYLDLLGDC